ERRRRFPADGDGLVCDGRRDDHVHALIDAGLRVGELDRRRAQQRGLIDEHGAGGRGPTHGHEVLRDAGRQDRSSAPRDARAPAAGREGGGDAGGRAGGSAAGAAGGGGGGGGGGRMATGGGGGGSDGGRRRPRHELLDLRPGQRPAQVGHHPAALEHLGTVL